MSCVVNFNFSLLERQLLRRFKNKVRFKKVSKVMKVIFSSTDLDNLLGVIRILANLDFEFGEPFS